MTEKQQIVRAALSAGLIVFEPTGESKSRFKGSEYFLDVDGELRYFSQETHWVWADSNPRPIYRRVTTPKIEKGNP